MSDFLFGMMAQSALTPRGRSAPIVYYQDNESIRHLSSEVAKLRRDLDVAYLILAKHGLVDLPKQQDAESSPDA